MLSKEHEDYLLSRTYTKEMLTEEGLWTINPGVSLFEGVNFNTTVPLIAWPCRSMSGALIGVSTKAGKEHTYRWHEAIDGRHLPILYGSQKDHDILYNTGKFMITEGSFDRAALKQCFPEYAVYARLSKGLGKAMRRMILRYANICFLAFDQDGPGIKSSEKITESFGDKIETHVLKYPYKDPANMLETKGKNYTKMYLEKQVRAFEI